MELSDEMKQAVRNGLKALAEEIAPGTRVIIKVNGRPVAVLVLTAPCKDGHGAIEASYYHWLRGLGHRH